MEIKRGPPNAGALVFRERRRPRPGSVDTGWASWPQVHKICILRSRLRKASTLGVEAAVPFQEPVEKAVRTPQNQGFLGLTPENKNCWTSRFQFGVGLCMWLQLMWLQFEAVRCLGDGIRLFFISALSAAGQVGPRDPETSVWKEPTSKTVDVGSRNLCLPPPRPWRRPLRPTKSAIFVVDLNDKSKFLDLWHPLWGRSMEDVLATPVA